VAVGSDETLGELPNFVWGEFLITVGEIYFLKTRFYIYSSKSIHMSTLVWNKISECQEERNLIRLNFSAIFHLIGLLIFPRFDKFVHTLIERLFYITL